MSDADFASHHIEGYARAAQERDLDGFFRVPLFSHVEDNLYVGGCINEVLLPAHIRYVISLYPWERYKMVYGGTRVECALYDAAAIPDETTLEGLAELASRFVDKAPTLIHCQAGLNRSNLISALMLIRHKGKTPEEAISLLREKRCDVVLCNQTFEDWLKQQG